MAVSDEKTSNKSLISIVLCPNNWFKKAINPVELIMLVLVRLTILVYAKAWPLIIAAVPLALVAILSPLAALVVAWFVVVA